MGPFFFVSNKLIPEYPYILSKFNWFKFFEFIPPNAIIFFLVCLVKFLNLFKPKKVLFLLNNEATKIISTFCNSFSFISFKVWADPKIINSIGATNKYYNTSAEIGNYTIPRYEYQHNLMAKTPDGNIIDSENINDNKYRI